MALGLLIYGALAESGMAQTLDLINISADFSSEAQAVQESVNNQPRTEYQPIGIRLGQFLSFGDTALSPQAVSDPTLTPLRPGATPDKSAASLRDSQVNSFLLRPGLETDLVFDDNVFRVDERTVSDTIFVLRPTLTLESDWLNHFVDIKVGGEFGRHQDFKDEDYDDYFISTRPRIDVDEHTVLELELGYSSAHTERGSTDDELEGPEPAIDRLLNVEADWQYQADKYSTRMLYRYSQIDALDNGQIERDFLDAHGHVWLLRQGYELTTGTTAWLRPGLLFIDYRQSRDDNGFVRDNQGWSFVAGLTIDRSAVSFLELGLGVLFHDFEQNGLDDFLDLVYVGRLLWNITPLFTLDVKAERTVEVVESTSAPISLDDSVSLELAWDPRENLIFGATTGFTRSDYATLPGQDKEEDRVEIGFNVQYLLNSNLYVEARYDYEQLDSSQAGSDYQNNVFTLRAGVQL